MNKLKIKKINNKNKNKIAKIAKIAKIKKLMKNKISQNIDLNKLRNKGLVLMMKTKGKKSGPYFLYYLIKSENVTYLKEGDSPDFS